MSRPVSITKTLTANDVGDTGGHQAGILVPKALAILAFFPTLSEDEKNPRVTLTFREEDGMTRWQFVFVHYNNRLYGGTRNEYRLTCMTRYLRSKNAKVGDEVTLSRSSEGQLLVICRHTSQVYEQASQAYEIDGVLRLTGGWKIIRIR